MKIKKMLLAATLSAGLFSATSANAVLTLTLGGQGVYDSDLNITWLQNANLAATNNFGVSGIYGNGTMSWHTAQNWIAGMNAANYLGFNDWRLPTTIDPGISVCNFANSSISYGFCEFKGPNEMAHLYFDELGNKSYYDASGNYQPGWGLTNTGPFSNIQLHDYWSGTEYAPNTYSSNTGYLYPYSGFECADPELCGVYAWAVRPGGNPAAVTSPVPEPEMYAMLLAGLGLLGFTARHRKQSA